MQTLTTQRHRVRVFASTWTHLADFDPALIWHHQAAGQVVSPPVRALCGRRVQRWVTGEVIRLVRISNEDPIRCPDCRLINT